MGVKGSKPCGSEASSCSSASSQSATTGSRNRRRRKPSRVFQSSCLGSNSWCRRSRFADKTCDSDDKGRGSPHGKVGCSRKSEIQSEVSNWNEPSASSSGEPSSSPSSRMLSRFSFVPGNVSFKIGPTHSEPSRMFAEPEDFSSQTQTQASNAVIKTPQNQETTSAQPQPTNNPDTSIPRIETLSNPTDPPQNGFPYFDRGTRVREPTDENARFTRSLSVGRLRDRVLRRTSSYSPFEQNREDRINEPEANISTMPTTFAYPQDTSSLSIETRYHRSNFLERRRRIRSQRAGRRFENLSGRERSCILSGQHRTINCTCRLTNVGPNNEESSAGVSISRIVLLAEALFEVLDEIHQQSVVLSARNTVSSFGSLPAPCDAVEALPLKTYFRPKNSKNDDAAQCYICLLEYEDGDGMRVLPCKHEFHKGCVDKWLKDIHRICPLCRGDICSLSG